MNPPPNVKPVWSPRELANALRRDLGSRTTTTQLDLLRALLRFDDWSFNVLLHRSRPIDVATALHGTLRGRRLRGETRRQFRRILHRVAITLHIEVAFVDGVTLNIALRS